MYLDIDVISFIIYLKGIYVVHHLDMGINMILPKSNFVNLFLVDLDHHRLILMKYRLNFKIIRRKELDLEVVVNKWQLLGHLLLVIKIKILDLAIIR